MQLNSTETSLVIVGAWNPAILTPQWVMQHALGEVQSHEHMVQVLFPTGLNGAFEFPRYSMPGFQYVARPDALVLIPESTSVEALDHVGRIAGQLLEQLRHTPIGGLGHNFEFVDEAPDADWLGIFDAPQNDLVELQPDWQVVRSTVATSFHFGPVVINTQRYFENGKLIMKFNFHHPVSNADAARQALAGENGHKTMRMNFEVAHDIVGRLYSGDAE